MSDRGLQFDEILLIVRVVASTFDLGTGELGDSVVGFPEGRQQEVDCALLDAPKDHHPQGCPALSQAQVLPSF